MRVWFLCFFVLFALAEFFKWLRGFSVPLPIYILGGAFLAVASNYDKIFGSYLSNIPMISPTEVAQEIPKLESAANSTPISLSPISDIQKESQEKREKTKSL
jgi:hypothetical protein